MAKRIAIFDKVSFEQFKEGLGDCFGDCYDEKAREVYENLKLPARATGGSAGYDFFAPVDLTLAPGETVKIQIGRAHV